LWLAKGNKTNDGEWDEDLKTLNEKCKKIKDWVGEIDSKRNGSAE